MMTIFPAHRMPTTTSRNITKFMQLPFQSVKNGLDYNSVFNFMQLSIVNMWIVLLAVPYKM